MKKLKIFLLASIALIILTYAAAYPLNNSIKSLYARQLSYEVLDRNGERISLKANYRGYYAEDVGVVPQAFKDLLIKKEDNFFYYHPGINPVGIIRGLLQRYIFHKPGGSSTLTQQLVKNLLGNENERTIGNKITEVAYTLALELYASKEEILTMYANTVYFGNQTQGLKTAGYYYFGRTPEALSETQNLELLATLTNPSVRYPGTYKNKQVTEVLVKKFRVNVTHPSEANGLDIKKEPYIRKTITSFEIESSGANCVENCALTIDATLTETLRDILKKNIDSAAFNSVENGAIVVIKLSPEENELLAIIGSPDPLAGTGGKQINMALEPRPIGSTAKPFIYAKAFEKGARPYTLVDDREYKYQIGTGFSLYPKNYDGLYHGVVTLHQALSNSLNVPTVKTLEFEGVDYFTDFLTNSLQFHPLQQLEDYGLGIALGGLEMDLLTLSNYFTIFPSEGILKPLKMVNSGGEPHIQPPMTEKIVEKINVIDPSFVKLVNKILSDRSTGVDQFSLKSNLNLTHSNYAVKTGTSYDYHDSWTIGYTPDFLVGVWIGNSSNKPISQISGQAGAGKIWHETMELMLNSPYNNRSEFNFEGLKEFNENGTVEFGLPNDNYDLARNIMTDNILILEPHNGDVFSGEPGVTVPLRSREKVDWHVNGKYFGMGDSLSLPAMLGTHKITASSKNGQKQTVNIEVSDEYPNALR